MLFDSLINVLKIVNDQRWSSKAFKNPPKFKYFKCNTSNIEAESVRIAELPDQQKEPWENKFRGKEKNYLILSGSVERSQKKGYFMLSVTHTRSMDEVANREHVRCGMAARSEIVMAYSSDSLLG